MTKFIPVIIFVVTTNALAQSLLKQGMLSYSETQVSSNNLLAIGGRVALDPIIIAGMFVMVISMATHLWVLSRVPLTFAYPFISLSYILILAVGAFVFKEALNTYHFLGTLLICAGIVCISRAGQVAGA